MLIDLDELAALDRALPLFGHNRAAVFGFRDEDHGDGGDLRIWVRAKLKGVGIAAEGKLRVLCYPRLFGYVFNPLSVWFCHDAGGALAAIIYEVHNTYGGRHAYVLPVQGDADVIQQAAAKAFHVSPFLSMDCTYDFRIRPPADSVTIAIAETEHGAPILTAIFKGRRRALTGRKLLGLLLRYPLMTLKIITMIHFEAVRLMLKGVPRHAHDGAAT